MHRAPLALALQSLTLSLAACSAPPGGGDAGTDAGPLPATEREMFDALGVSTAVTPRTYVDRLGARHTLDAGYNPLGRGVRVFQPLAEVYLAGRGVADTGHPNQLLLDDGKNAALGTPLALQDASESWMQNKLLASVPVDLDGDGVDEVVNLFWIAQAKELHAAVVRCVSCCTGNGGGFAKVADSILGVQDTSQDPASRDWFKHSFAAADVDGDGRQELVVVNFGGVDVCRAAADFTFSCTARSTNASRHMSVARGRFDDDPERQNDSLVVAWGDGTYGYVAIYDGTPDAFSPNAFSALGPTLLSVNFVDQTSVISYSEAYVAAGDLDLDGRDEVLLAARRAGTTTHDLVLMDDRSVGFRFFRAFRASLGEDEGPPCQQFFGAICAQASTANGQFQSPLFVFTKQARPTLEKALYAASFIFDDLANLLPSSTTALPSGTDIGNGVKQYFTGVYSALIVIGIFNHAPHDVVAGDLDGSGADTLVAMWDRGFDGLFTVPLPITASTLARTAWDPNTATWPRWVDFVTTTGGLATTDCAYDCPYSVGLAMPNVDRDSPTVRYTGQHEVTFSRPRVLAVLSAPPYFAGLNDENSQTSISFGTGTGLEQESSIGFTAGFSVGYEAPNLFGLTKAASKVTFDTAMDWISRDRVEMTQTETWTTQKEDAVVFSVIPFDVYYYQVLSSPDPADLGRTLTVNVPRKLSTHKVPVDLYNASTLDGPKVTPALLGHTPGVPSSYPGTSACAAAPVGGTFGSTTFLLDSATWCFASTEALHVGVGSGSVGFEIARTGTSAAGTSNDFEVGLEVEAGAGGFTFGASVGFHYGYSYTLDTTNSYAFGGQVGDLPDATHGYDFGLMAHRKPLAGQSGYPVFLVDYWVTGVE
jgi:hypothetical protein